MKQFLLAQGRQTSGHERGDPGEEIWYTYTSIQPDRNFFVMNMVFVVCWEKPEEKLVFLIFLVANWK